MKGLTNFFVKVAQKYLPDAFLFAILLTVIAFLMALGLTGKSVVEILTAWGGGLWGLLAFSMQMTLILVTGHAMASSPAVKGALRALASVPKTPVAGLMMTAFVAAVASWINWGFGLVVGALLAREVAKRVRGVDYPMLVAAAYSGFVVWHGGISGSIPLAIASKGHIVEKLIGVVPVSRTIFSGWNLAISWAMIIALPVLFYFMGRKKDNVVQVDPALLEDEVPTPPPAVRTPATALENSWIVTLVTAGLGFAYLVWHFATKGFDLNLNIVITIFLFVGLLLHWRPIAYVRAVEQAIKGAGGIALQFPLYGGIQGIMVGTGLAGIIANWFISFSNQTTFPLFTFISGGVINFFVPSGGGQWAVQGPINIPAGAALGVDPSVVAMSIAYGDQWTNMVQPFWALPLLGIAKLGIRDIMGYCMMTLLVSGVIMGLGLLLFV
ncbi:MAG TPA: short-chain fatty acid transporter [Spirochaetales bacterium]|nr:short-chain fatty acid transporter [Spirochaetales bacterium]